MSLALSCEFCNGYICCGSAVGLDGVRVHTDAHVAESAPSVGALAYTVGRDAVFASGQYSLENPAGRRLFTQDLGRIQRPPGARDGGWQVSGVLSSCRAAEVFHANGREQTRLASS